MKALTSDFTVTTFEDEDARILESQITQLWHPSGQLDIVALVQENKCARIENGLAHMDGPDIVLTYSLAPSEFVVMSVCIWRLTWQIKDLRKNRIYRIRLKKK